MLIPTLRHGFIFYIAPPSMSRPLDELPPPPRQRVFKGLRPKNTSTAPTGQCEPSTTVARNAPPADTPQVLREIQNAVLTTFSVTAEEFFGPGRSAKIAEARLASMALARKLTLHIIEEIGPAHYRHSGCVLNAEKRCASLRDTDRRFRDRFTRAEQILLTAWAAPAAENLKSQL